MNLFKKYRPFIKSIKPYGLYVEVSRKHLKVRKEGSLVASMSLTPGDPKVAVDHTLRHLISAGHLPKVNRSHYVYELKRAKV